MMTEKLYYENQYEKSFTAEIINIVEKDNEFHIVLDKTNFYPEGGGQPSDIGTIESIPVSSVYENDGLIYHITNKKPIKIHKVKCSINWENRFDFMQQHLGQHILSACLLEKFNASTVAAHLGLTSCTIDVDKLLNITQIEEAISYANDIIFENIPVDILYPTKSELKKLSIKKTSIKIGEQIRIVKISDLDINPCCGVHPKSTLEVQIIKVVKFEKHKTGTRIEFLCGKRGIQNSFINDKFASTVCSNLHCNPEDAILQIEKLTQDFSKLSAENRAIKSEIADYEIKEIIENCDKIGGISIIKLIHSDMDLKHVNLLASKLVAYDNVIVLFGVKADDRATLIFMCSKDLNIVSMNTLLKDAITLIDGKGGGSNFSAQGGGKSTNNISSALDYAYMKVQNAIN
ncbi:alanyl-tRNA editing protein AlaX-L [Clostridium gasigenes]|nr:DHHA1 domain-containing protein [Clostridium gasigenes]MBU3089639.1 alanyl-tRNA editing protein AlaX-L [Clostridium gasigenes]